MNTEIAVTTKENLKAFYRLAIECFDRDYVNRFYANNDDATYTTDTIARERQRITDAVLSFALNNYEIGTPSVERSDAGDGCVMASMYVRYSPTSGINGCIMYRNREVTAHS